MLNQNETSNSQSDQQQNHSKYFVVRGQTEKKKRADMPGKKQILGDHLSAISDDFDERILQYDNTRWIIQRNKENTQHSQQRCKAIHLNKE